MRAAKDTRDAPILAETSRQAGEENLQSEVSR
jgi:hypothetical protein